MASLTPLSGTLGTQRAAHLLRRTTFGANAADTQSLAGMTVDQAVAALMTVPPAPGPPLDPNSGQTWVHNTPGNTGEFRRYFYAWWIYQQYASGTSCVEKMVFFLHTHFTSKLSVVRATSSAYHQLALFRHYALGDFRTLTKKVCVDNAMLRFLDGRTNLKNRPNENFGRELLELYSIGKGDQIGPGNYTTYTEDDVREAARVLTGWNSDETYQTLDPDTGIPTGRIRTTDFNIPNQHDTGDKQFSAAFNQTVIQGTNTHVGIRGEVSQLIDMIFAQAATAEHICRKLYRFFVHYKITSEIEQDIIQPLAQTFITNNFMLQPVLEQLFKSQHFFDADDTSEGDEILGGIVKSPLDLFLQTLRFFEIDLPDQSNLEIFYTSFNRGVRLFLPLMGMIPYEPAEVAGYPAYHQGPSYHRNWISSNTLAYRYAMINQLILGTGQGNQNLGYQLDPLGYIENATFFTDKSDPILLVSELAEFLFAVTLPQVRLDHFINDILLDNLDPSYWTQLWGEYQLTADDMEVRPRLAALFNAMLQSPEYQLG